MRPKPSPPPKRFRVVMAEGGSPGPFRSSQPYRLLSNFKEQGQDTLVEAGVQSGFTPLYIPGFSLSIAKRAEL